MAQKATIVWAAAFGAVAAVGAGGVMWRLHRAAPLIPAQSAAPATPAASAPRSIAVAPPADAPSVPEKGASPAPTPSAPAAAAPATPSPAPLAEQADAPRPQFDIVRVEASGEAVIAGHAAPKAKITVTDHGEIVAEADADASGQFVVLPPAFKPGSHALGLTARVGDGAAVQSPGVVGLDVAQPASAAAAPLKALAPATPAEPPKKLAAPAPAPPPAVTRKLVTGPAQPAANSSALQNSGLRGETQRPAATDTARTSVVALAAPESAPPRSSDSAAAKAAGAAVAPKQTEAPKADILAPKVDAATSASTVARPAEPLVLARTDAAAPARGTPRTAITGVAANEAGRMVTTGVAEPGALLRVYLNGSFLASVTASARGTWSLTVEHGMTGGAYAIRADEIDRGKGAVISRAEVPFNYPQNLAETTAGAKPAASTGAAAAVSSAAPADQPKPNAATAVASAAPQPAAAAQSRALSVVAQPTAAPAASTTARPAAGSALSTAVQPSSPPASTTPQPPAAPPLAASAALTDPSVQPAAPKPPPLSGEVQAGATPTEPESNVVVKVIDTHKVVPGDNLWDISWHVYGDGLRYTQIYAANSNQIRNPRLIYPGQIFVLPQATPF